MNRTIRVGTLVKVVAVLVLVVAAYALGHRDGVRDGYQSGADETAATYEVQMTKLAGVR